MASAEHERQRRQEPPAPPPPAPDIQLAAPDRAALLEAVAGICADDSTARPMLRQLAYPLGQMPAWAGMRPEDWWNQVFTDFDNGITETPYRRLVLELLRRYRANALFLRLAAHYIDSTAAAPGPATDHGARTCHVIVRASSEPERDAAAASLRGVQLDPREVWSTQHAVSYEVGLADVPAVRQALGRTNLGWTVVPPGQPDYLLRELFVQGPDGSRYRLVDAPAQQTFRNVAGEVMGQYGPEFAEAGRPTVIDHVQQGGHPERVNPDDTLHDAGVRDGDQLRVGIEAAAGAVNVNDYEDALDRALDQISGYAQPHADMAVRVDSTTLPTEYEIDFVRESFGPPPAAGAEPTRISRHTVLIQLGSEFPETAPEVYWITPIFHPNVFPNYDCEQARDRPDMEGWVCLGMLAESWYPARSLADLCRMLVDMAGYRNYDLFQLVSPDNGAQPGLLPNFVNPAAARWVVAHQNEITAIGGRPIVPGDTVEPKGSCLVIYPVR